MKKSLSLFFLTILMSMMAIDTWASDMPTDISLYSSNGIVKAKTDDYNIDIPIAYLAYKANSRSSMEYCEAFVVSPSGVEHVFKYWDRYGSFPSSQYLEKDGYIFFDLQANEPGAWRLKLVQTYAGDWLYYQRVVV